MTFRRDSSITVTVGPAGSSARYATDGVNDHVRINAVIQAVAGLMRPGGTAVVSLLAGEYFLGGPVNLQSGVTLQGSGRGATILTVDTNFDSANYWAVGATGSLTTGTSIPLTADAQRGATQITCTTGAELSAIAALEHVALISDLVWEAKNLSNREVGELVKVVSVAGAVMTVYGMVRDDYLLADTARLYRISFTTGCGVQDLTIRQAAPLNTRSGSPPPMVAFQKCKGAFVRNVEVYNNDGPGICDMHSVGTAIESCYIHDLTDNSPSNRLGYGILIGGMSEYTVVANNRIERARHAVDSGPHRGPTDALSNNGIPRGVAVTGNTAHRIANVPYSTHCEAEGWNFTGNVANGSESIGFFMRGRACNVTGNTIEWCSGGIQVGNTGSHNTSSGSGSGSQVVGNTIRNIRSITPGSTGTNFGGYGIVLALTDNVTVHGNAVADCDAAGVRLRQFAQRCSVTANTVVNCNLLNAANIAAVEVESCPVGTTATLTLSGTTITATGLSGLTNAIVGKTIVISGAATAANNGPFAVTSFISASSVTWENPSGATDANNGAVSWYVESVTDNLVDGNTATNRPGSSYTREGAGRAKYFYRDPSINGNARNTITNNVAVGMETDFMLATAVLSSANNVHNGLITSGNEKITTKVYPISVRTTSISPTLLLTLPTVTGRNYVVKGHIQGTNSGAGRWYYEVQAFYDNNAGVVTQRVGTPVTEVSESSSSVTLTVDVSGTNMTFTIAAISSAVTWSGSLSVSEVRL